MYALNNALQYNNPMNTATGWANLSGHAEPQRHMVVLVFVCVYVCVCYSTVCFTL